MAKKPKLTEEQELTICRMYQELQHDKQCIAKIRAVVPISHKWVYAILKHYGIKTNRLRLAGPRTNLLGVDVTPQVKRSLHEEARRRGMSKSSLGSKFISDALRRRGYDVTIEDEGAA